MFRRMLVTGLAVSLCALGGTSLAQWSAIKGSKWDWHTAKSRQEAVDIENKLYKHVVEGLDATYKEIAADWDREAHACGNDTRYNKECVKRAENRRDAALNSLRTQRHRAGIDHKERLEDIANHYNGKDSPRDSPFPRDH